MALSILTAVTEINNLSDARYCAGMGVDILGFNLSQPQAAPLSPETVRDIAGWVAGVQLAGAFAPAPPEIINETASQCQLDLLILQSGFLVDDLAKLDLPVILQVEVHKDTYENELREMLELYASQVQYFLITSSEFQEIDETNRDFLKSLSSRFPVLLGFGLDKETVKEELQAVEPAGIALKGGHEIKPGLKSFDDLADILETLEVD